MAVLLSDFRHQLFIAVVRVHDEFSVICWSHDRSHIIVAILCPEELVITTGDWHFHILERNPQRVIEDVLVEDKVGTVISKLCHTLCTVPRTSAEHIIHRLEEIVKAVLLNHSAPFILAEQQAYAARPDDRIVDTLKHLHSGVGELQDVVKLFLVVRNTFPWEYINEYALIPRTITVGRTDACRVTAAKLSM